MRYPLGQYEREFIQSKTGKKLEEITLDEVLKGHISSDDIKISKETLKAQGQVAAENGNFPMEKNFERAAELTEVPDDVILKMYELEKIPEEEYKRATASQCGSVAGGDIYGCGSSRDERKNS